MIVLDKKLTLERFLQELCNQRISIVTGFASGTEPLVQEILDNGNEVNLIVGTINAFSSPKFIDAVKNNESKKLSLYVDFRYEKSTHWKLYLIEPNVVIIGSANFTKIGVKLSRDTMLILEDKNLYEKYHKKIRELKSNKLIIKTVSENFDKYYSEYIEKHKNVQASLISVTRNPDVKSWLNEESNQSIPLFIWDTDIEEEDEDEAYNLIKDDELSIKSKESYELLTYECRKKDLPYQEGELIITSSHKGSHIKFQKIDRISHYKGMNYLYCFKNKRIKRPFEIKEIRKKLKDLIPKLYDKEKTTLYREDIENII